MNEKDNGALDAEGSAPALIPSEHPWLKLRPHDVPEYAAPAWASCVLWAASEPKVVRAFLTETSIKPAPPMPLRDLLLNDVHGRERGIVETFILWVNECVWGTWDALPDTRKASTRASLR